MSLVQLAVRPGEPLHVPDSGYDLGGGHDALVLYATPRRLTLKYTRTDNVVAGCTIHLEGLCVDPGLLRRYRQLDREGRGRLPALRGGQPLGRASGTVVGVAVRDTGQFMDPRDRRSWWRGA